MATKQPKLVKKYDQVRNGFAGNFGSGANIDIFYLQTAFSPGNINAISLIEEIPGSEKWDVRDLFQRHVNKKRVDSLKRYLTDAGSVKFFNPITLVLLPYDYHNHKVMPDVKSLKVSKRTDEYDQEIIEYENAPYYKLDMYVDPAQSELHWRQDKIKLVAIDGQHRLSAIKQIQSNANLSSKILGDWSIPAVILIMSKSDEQKSAPSILEVVRKTFININQEAAQINKSRLIILDDESVNRICCQEIVNSSHKNDQKPFTDDIVLTRTPLMFFDWRGEVEGNKEKRVEGSLLSLVELELLLENFILGEDGSTDQKNALNIDDIIPKIDNFKTGNKLTNDEANRIREQFKTDLMPAIQYLLENFQPYADYIQAVRDIQFPEDKSELTELAFKQICFGSPPVTDAAKYDDIQIKVKEMVTDFSLAKQKTIDELVARDIGLRAVFSAFGLLKEISDSEVGETIDWLEYAKWFTEKVNKVIDDGWFKGSDNEERSEIVQKFTTHVVFKPSGDIENYKPKDVDDAFGVVIGLEVSAGESDSFKESYWDKVETRLKRPLLKGYKTKFRADLQTEALTKTEFNAKVNRLASDATNERILDFKVHYFRA